MWPERSIWILVKLSLFPFKIFSCPAVIWKNIHPRPVWTPGTPPPPLPSLSARPRIPPAWDRTGGRRTAWSEVRSKIVVQNMLWTWTMEQSETKIIWSISTNQRSVLLTWTMTPNWRKTARTMTQPYPPSGAGTPVTPGSSSCDLDFSMCVGLLVCTDQHCVIIRAASEVTEQNSDEFSPIRSSSAITCWVLSAWVKMKNKERTCT